MSDMPPPEPSNPQPGPAYPPPPPYYPPGGQGLPPGAQPPYPYPYPYVVARRTNGMAIASMVLGILWIYWIGSILALIFGYVARKQIRERGDEGNGMAVAGIVLGWIGVATLVAMIIFFIWAGTQPGFWDDYENSTGA